MQKPTATTYTELQHVFDVLNEELFGGKLPPCLMTLQREKATLGYFSHKRFVSSGGGAVTDEIALNPAYFARIGLQEIQTVAHEMVHLWQAHLGNPGRARYHNHEWARKMEEIGLMPSDTGQPGGRKVGQKMADYAIEGGRFLEVFNALATADFKISWYDRYVAGDGAGGTGAMSAALSESGLLVMPGEGGNERKPTRVKYLCQKTGDAVWGRPGLHIKCGVTGHDFVPEASYAPRQGRA